jgi:hypothetical protein
MTKKVAYVSAHCFAMPAQKRAGKRPRAPNATTRKLTALCLDMGDKLDRATDAARALHLMGHGLKLCAGDAEESDAITAVAWIACERLDTLRRTWRNLCQFALAEVGTWDGLGPIRP